MKYSEAGRPECQTDLFTLKEVRGPAENPTELVLN